MVGVTLLGGFQFFEQQRASALADDLPTSVQIKRPGSGRWVICRFCDVFLYHCMDGTNRVDPGPRSSGNNRIGAVTGDSAKSFCDGQIGRGLSKGDRVVRTSEVVIDGDMTGWHIGQILEQPQWRNFPQAARFLVPPFVVLKLLRFVETLDHRVGKFTGFGHDVIASINHTRPIWIECTETDPSVLKRFLRYGHSHFNLTAHQLACFANFFFLGLFQFTIVLDGSGKLGGLTTNRRWKILCGNSLNVVHATLLDLNRIPEGRRVVSNG